MSKTKTIDLTSGPILKTLAELALPIMASSLLGTAYNITDMAWIGMLGSKAVVSPERTDGLSTHSKVLTVECAHCPHCERKRHTDGLSGSDRAVSYNSIFIMNR